MDLETPEGSVAPKQTEIDFSRWNLWSLLFWVLVGLGAVGAASLAGLQDRTPVLFDMGVDTFLYGLPALWLWAALRRSGSTWAEFAGLAMRRRELALVAFLAVGVICTSIGSAAAVGLLLTHLAPSWAESFLLDDTDSPASLVELLQSTLSAVIVAPLVEEAIFRGVLFRKWRQSWGPVSAWIVSSFVFGILHQNVIGSSIFGLAMGLLYVYTRTLWAPIVCHVINNACASSLEWAFYFSDPNEAEAESTLEDIQVYLWVGITLLATGLPIIAWFFRKAWYSLIPQNRFI